MTHTHHLIEAKSSMKRESKNKEEREIITAGL